MKTPPLLLGATLLFWGWQTGFLAAGAVMAAILEAARFLKVRWEFDDDDFSRVWVFCSVLFLATAAYAFTSNEGPGSFRSLLQDPNYMAQRNAGASSARTATAIIRWLPMIFFLFMAAQVYSSREGIPLEAVSLILRRRRRKATQRGQALPPARNVDISYAYFAACLFAASAHSARGTTFFWGLCGLLTWALWSRRSKRFSPVAWTVALGAVVGLGYLGQLGVDELQRLVENYNPQWLARRAGGGADPRHNRTALGQVGRLKTSGKIVIRLQPKGGSEPPTYLREASYRVFKSPLWYAGSSQDDFGPVNSETNETTWILVRGKTNSAAVNIACYLPGGRALLPLPTGSGRLENVVFYILQRNSAGSVLAYGPGLVIFDALYGPGEIPDLAPDTNQDLQVSPREVPAIDQVLSELQLTKGQDRQQVLHTISGFFQGQFTYSTWQDRDLAASTNATPLSRFLLNTHRGHCEYFATATVLLLRRIGIQARYAVGYAVHEPSGSGYVVRERDAHAWCQVWNEDRKQWEDFDTTPPSWLKEEGARASAGQWLSDAWSRIWFEISKFRWGQSELRRYVFWVLGPVLALLLYQIAFRRRWKRQHRMRPVGVAGLSWPGLDSEFYQVESTLAGSGAARRPSEPLSNWLRRVAADPGWVELSGPMQKLLWLHYRYRFDPLGLDENERQALRRESQACLAQLGQLKLTAPRTA